MRKYVDRFGGGGITGFLHGHDSITVRYSNGKEYRYTYGSAGVQTVADTNRFKGFGSYLVSAFLNGSL